MNRITLIVVVVEVVLAAVGLLAGRWIGTPMLEGFRIDLRSGLLAVAATLPLVAFLVLSVSTGLASSAGFDQIFRETIIPLFAKCSVLEILLISIMAGLGEEIFFRGFLQGSLARVVHPWIALALASVLFGLAHYVSPAYAIFAGLIGAYLGVMLLVNGNLFVAMAVHALFDIAALLLLTRMTLSPPAGTGLP